MGKISVIALFVLGLLETQPALAQPNKTGCLPTASEHIGPLFTFEVPERATVGTGHLLEGVIRSAADCSPVARAKLELWLTNEAGDYDRAHRGAVFTDDWGRYSFESNFPTPHFGQPPRIYLRATASNYQTVVIVFEPQEAQTKSKFDINLSPLNTRTD